MLLKKIKWNVWTYYVKCRKQKMKHPKKSMIFFSSPTILSLVLGSNIIPVKIFFSTNIWFVSNFINCSKSMENLLLKEKVCNSMKECWQSKRCSQNLDPLKKNYSIKKINFWKKEKKLKLEFIPNKKSMKKKKLNNKKRVSMRISKIKLKVKKMT